MKADNAKKTGVNPRNYKSTLLLQDIDYGKHNTYYQERVIWTLDLKPDYTCDTDDFMLINIPIYCHMAELDMDEFRWNFLLIRLKDPSDH